ncbi:hypothetical protein [Nonomuraea candida]|uniref:hypothetical protein n=1 Tax=Nonomuraea candida TaxID=359159 RepID=UPI000AB25FAA|nr:hypothetical protein [Nonomuraea candida]
MLFVFRKRRPATASPALEPLATPSDEDLAGWLAHITAPDVAAGLHPHAQVSAR